MTTTIQIPVDRGGTNVPYNDGTGAYGMQSNNGYGYTTYLFPMLSEVMAWVVSYLASMQTISDNVDELLPYVDDMAALAPHATAIGNVGGSIANVNAVANGLPALNLIANDLDNLGDIAEALPTLNLLVSNVDGGAAGTDYSQLLTLDGGTA